MKRIAIHSKRIFAVLIGVIMMMITSCEDEFLDKPLQSNLTQENFPTSAEDALQATFAIYNTLRIPAFNSGLFPILDIMSDDALKGSNPTDQATTIGLYDSFEHTATEASLGRWWNTLYLGIKRANVVIENIPNIEMDEASANQYLAEARFLRALFYFDLVRAWGGVPIVTSVNQDVDTKRATQAEVFALIEEDLTFAADFLPLKSSYNNNQLGRASKGAAYALLARVELFQNKFEEAGSNALKVINAGMHGLEPVYENAHNEIGEHGIESVFEVGSTREENLENGGNQYANVMGVRGTPNRGWGFNRPSLDLMNSFETGDPRLEATVLFLGEVIDGVEILGDGQTPDELRDENGDLIEIECYVQKYWTPGETVPPQWGHNRRMIRYADVLLMAAEALNETGQSQQALQYINEVRNRARQGDNTILPDITTTDKDLLRDIILEERRYELAMEGHRFWDLVRHIDRTPVALQILSSLGFQENKHKLFAIPQAEIDIAGLTQNPNWD